MTSLSIDEQALPGLSGRTAIITGGASGIGIETVKLLVSRGATVHILDRNAPKDETGWWQGRSDVHFHPCNVTDWPQLREVVTAIGPFHMAFANAGVAETVDFFADTRDAEGKLALPESVLEVNFWGVLYVVKLAWSSMRHHHIKGSIVITGSTTGYAPEVALPVYSAGKSALVGLLRCLRHSTIKDNITVNLVAPAGTATPLIAGFVETLSKVGVVFNSPCAVALALVYSATATQTRRVEAYGKENEADIWKVERWNGRAIYVIGDKFTELEESTADLRPFWFGRENHQLVRFQQAALETALEAGT
ncbi:NAD(P)-binding protein [Xylariaceae sp. FL1651]|nr:NAD(P)-binding protein [Xylariaceae sp. FL1651]